MNTVLAIDDDPKNLKIIQGFLENKYHVITAPDGLEAWEILEKQHNTIDVVLLDRMMPKMNGMELNAKIKEHEDMKNIPIIMQTAAAEQEQITEGIKAGVYYYLTKPYNEDILFALIKKAVKHYERQKNLLSEITKHYKMLSFIEECRFVFSRLEEINDLTVYIANFFPDPEKRLIGISEMLINAVEHGNLGIDYKTKGKLKLANRFEEEIKYRQELKENINKRVRVYFNKTETEAALTITDEGNGFDWQSYIDFDPLRATDINGRGIALARTISFDALEYNAKGNEVRCVVKIGKPGGFRQT